MIIAKHQLKAATYSMGKDDIRYYLNGVLFVVNEHGQAALVSTDGHRMFIGKLSDDCGLEPIQIIIPDTAVREALKQTGKMMSLTLGAGAQLPALGAVSFTPIDAKYPDFTRVIPAKLSGEKALYNPHYLSDAQTALNWWVETKNPLAVVDLQMNGDKAALMTAYDAFVVIMPIRPNGKVHPTFTWGKSVGEEAKAA